MGSLMEELSSLQAFKRLAPTEDRTKEPRSITTEQLCICILGTSSRHLDLLLEGGDICPGNVMIALSPDCLQREETDFMKDKPRQLLVKKAMTFGRGGNTYFDAFEPPRRVTYFINEMPESFDTFGLECAMNGSKDSMSLLEDPLRWRVGVSDKVSLPPCIVLHGSLSPGLKHTLDKRPELKLVEGPPNDDKDVSLKHDIDEMLSAAGVVEGKVIVEKRCSGGFQKDVHLIHDANFLNGLSEVWQSLSVDEYITIEPTRSLPKSRTGISKSNATGALGDQLFSVGACLTVCRGLNDRLIFSKISAAATHTSRPDRSGSVYKELRTCLIDLGYTDSLCLQEVEESMKNQAKAVMKIVVESERSYTRSYIGTRTDFLELTFDLMRLHEVMTPVLSDVSIKHMFLGTRGDNSDGLSPARSLLHVMALRSHSVLLSSKTILFLLTQRFVDTDMKQFEDLQQYGNKIIVIAPKDSPIARKYVDDLIEYDLLDGTGYIQHAENIVRLLHQRNKQVSACISIGDNYSLVAGKLRQLLNLPGASLEAVRAANEKYLTYSIILTTPSAKYSSKAVKVKSWKDLESSSSKINFPAFAKMEAGKGAIGARVVHDADDYQRYLKHMFENTNNNTKDYELIDGNKSLVITELLQGDEYIIDIVMSHGQFITGLIRLAVQGKPSLFTCRAQSFPAQLSAEKESLLLTASHQMCYDLGLHDGVFNVELMDTEEGPKLIEINPRHGAYGIVFLTKRCLDEDIFMLNNLVNTGIRPTVVPLPPQHLCYSFLLSLQQHGHLVDDQAFKAMVETLKNRGIIHYATIRESRICTEDKVIAFLGVFDEDGQKSKIVLLTVAKALGLDTAEFPCDEFIESLLTRNGLSRSRK